MSTVPTNTGTTLRGVSTLPKAIELATLRSGSEDFLTLLDETKEIVFGYLYHRTGSIAASETILAEVYQRAVSKALALVSFATLDTRYLLSVADELIAQAGQLPDADIDTVYLPAVSWALSEEKTSFTTLHESLWTLSAADQRVLTLTLFVGLSSEKLAELENVTVDVINARLSDAKEKLLLAWQPVLSIIEKLHSLVFVPAFDLKKEALLRTSIVEKYNVLRMRRLQWITVGSFVAIFANVLVAGVIAFVVIVTPPTSLRMQKGELAALHAIILEKDIRTLETETSVGQLYDTSAGLAAYSGTRELTNLGLATAMEALGQEAKSETEINTVINLLRKASVAMVETVKFVAWAGLTMLKLL